MSIVFWSFFFFLAGQLRSWRGRSLVFATRHSPPAAEVEDGKMDNRHFVQEVKNNRREEPEWQRSDIGPG